MKESLAAGITAEVTLSTTPDMGISHLGEGRGVLSTPAMIGLMEQTAMNSILPHLDENEHSVGTMVHVWHRAPVMIGELVQCRTKLIERDRRKLLFEVELSAADVKLGDSTHERFVINLDKFNQ